MKNDWKDKKFSAPFSCLYSKDSQQLHEENAIFSEDNTSV